MSTESIASSSHSTALGESCASCGSPLAGDQRYCLECGERRSPTSSVLLGGPPGAGHAAAPPPSAPPVPPAGPPGESPWQRNTTLTVIAGVGVLLLAMGVGVLIGRAGGGKTTTAPAQVISVASTPAAGTGAGAGSSEASFTSSWPAGTTGFTVQLRTLPVSGTGVSAVEAAKTAASAKGAKAVGALKSEEFSSLHGESYVIYTGVYHTRAEAQKALAGLSKSFPGASVIEVSNKAGGSSGASGSGGSSGSGVGSSEAHPAPPSVLKNLNSSKGKSYEEKSKNLPDVVETG